MGIKPPKRQEYRSPWMQLNRHSDAWICE